MLENALQRHPRNIVSWVAGDGHGTPRVRVLVLAVATAGTHQRSVVLLDGSDHLAHFRSEPYLVRVFAYMVVREEAPFNQARLAETPRYARFPLLARAVPKRPDASGQTGNDETLVRLVAEQRRSYAGQTEPA